jgi:nucleotide-binding universal stress UspA family protein
MGGLGYASSALHWAIHLAQQARADLTILHVVEPISYDYPVASQIQQHWAEIHETDTPQGHHLRQALEEVQEAGVGATLRIRQGGVVHEIVAEMHESRYDLLAMGSPGSSHTLRHLLMPNVTAAVAETNSLPVLVAQLGQELMLQDPP